MSSSKSGKLHGSVTKKAIKAARRGVWGWEKKLEKKLAKKLLKKQAAKKKEEALGLTKQQVKDVIDEVDGAPFTLKPQPMSYVEVLEIRCGDDSKIITCESGKGNLMFCHNTQQMGFFDYYNNFSPITQVDKDSTEWIVK